MAQQELPASARNPVLVVAAGPEMARQPRLAMVGMAALPVAQEAVAALASTP
jgi:hypothetical protein